MSESAVPHRRAAAARGGNKKATPRPPVDDLERDPAQERALAQVPPSVEQFLAELLSESAHAPQEPNDEGTGPEPEAPDIAIADDLLDAEQHLADRAALFCAVFAPGEAIVSRSPILGELPGQAPVQAAYEVEDMLRQTVEGKQLLQAMRETVPPFAVFERAGFSLPWLLARTYLRMTSRERAALFRRVLQLAAGERGLRVPDIGDEELMAVAARVGVPVSAHGP